MIKPKLFISIEIIYESERRGLCETLANLAAMLEFIATDYSIRAFLQSSVMESSVSDIVSPSVSIVYCAYFS